MVKVIIPRKCGSYKIYDDVLQIDNTNRLLIFRNNMPFKYYNPQYYLDSFLFYSCLDNGIELLDWVLYSNSEIYTNLTKILLSFLKTKGSITVNLEKIKYKDYRWVSELLVDSVEVVEITNKENIIWKLKDCTT